MPNAAPVPSPEDDAFAHIGVDTLSQQWLFETLYPEHLATLRTRLSGQLERSGVETLLLTAGSPGVQVFDDLPTSFRSNPHLRHWLPFEPLEHSVLLLDEAGAGELFLFAPADYWHHTPALPDWAEQAFAVRRFETTEALRDALRANLRGRNAVAAIGDGADHHELEGVASNPPALLAELDFDRGIKTPFEQRLMQLASRRAVAGHRAAEAAFRACASEFEIHQAYLSASLQTEGELPYGNIVALNEHGAVLHYQYQDRSAPSPCRSLLIDAGARACGYASDITRSYAAEPGPFADLIGAVDEAQQAVVTDIAPGRPYLELHESMHRRLAEILCAADILRCSADRALEESLTLPFMPHGLGHLLGLQTHDVAGQQDRTGKRLAPPEAYPALRTTRIVEVGQAFTVEPGLYFIPMLLEPLYESANGKLLNRARIDALSPFGGIRIEDNVIVTDTGVWNLTRQAFAEQPELPA